MLPRWGIDGLVSVLGAVELCVGVALWFPARLLKHHELRLTQIQSFCLLSSFLEWRVQSEMIFFPSINPTVEQAKENIHIPL